MRQTARIQATSRPTLGLALSGGGIKGFAHLGVLRALEEQDIRVDYLAGTSMGGLVAGLYGAGVPLDDLTAFAAKLKIMDMASPDRSWRGFFDQRKLAGILASLLGRDDVAFEELGIPVSVVATDLTTAEAVVLDSGPLIPALLATSALPLFFAPVEHQGRCLADGGVLNNVPFDVARAMGASRVLAVAFDTTVKLDLGKAPVTQDRRGPSLGALRRFRGHTPEWRQPFLIAEASMGMMQQLIDTARLEACPPDVYLRVPMDKIGLLTFGAGAAAIEAGYAAAQDHLHELRRLTAPLPAPWRRRLTDIGGRVARAWQALRAPMP